jgi:hypothetical protein
VLPLSAIARGTAVRTISAGLLPLSYLISVDTHTHTLSLSLSLPSLVHPSLLDGTSTLTASIIDTSSMAISSSVTRPRPAFRTLAPREETLEGGVGLTGKNERLLGVEPDQDESSWSPWAEEFWSVEDAPCDFSLLNARRSRYHWSGTKGANLK